MTEHSHNHHAHTNNTLENERLLKLAFFIIFSFMLVELVGGVLSGSLALLADAGHMFTDAAALAMAWFAFLAGRRPPDEKHSYGHQRYQVVAAFVNGLFLLLIVAWIVIEAFERFNSPRAIDVPVMLSVAVVGLLVNLITFKLLHGGDHDNLNVKGAMLHVLSDILGSVAAITSGVLIYFFNWAWVDPALSLVVASLIVGSGLRLVKESLHILLEGVPQRIDVALIKQTIEQKFQPVVNVHHVHTWSLNNEEILMTMHVKVSNVQHSDKLLCDIHQLLQEEFSVTHATIQIETEFCSSHLEQY
ncbi:MAG: cation diffusion facilitator family transporter [Kangiellaceae bacterium]|jgi:cobalt-zinc-cadmium efflux system protein|nr:cation diffusion facilitator family transporter [Kangiellaceae bacterium]